MTDGSSTLAAVGCNLELFLGQRCRQSSESDPLCSAERKATPLLQLSAPEHGSSPECRRFFNTSPLDQIHLYSLSLACLVYSALVFQSSPASRFASACDGITRLAAASALIKSLYHEHFRFRRVSHQFSLLSYIAKSYCRILTKQVPDSRKHAWARSNNPTT